MVVLDPLKVEITNYTGEEEVEVVNNPNDDSAGTHKAIFSNEIYIEREDFMEDAPNKFFRLKPDGVVRLKDAYIIKCDEVIKDETGKVVKLKCSYFENSKSGNDQSGIKVKGTIHWVSAKHAVDVVINEFGTLVDESKTFTGDNIEEVFNKNSWNIKEAKAEAFVENTEEKRFQFLRKGYYYLTKKENGKLVFNETVSLKDKFKTGN